MITLTRFWMSSVAVAAITIAGSSYVMAADTPVTPQVLGGSSTDAAPAQAVTATSVPTPAPGAQIPTPPETAPGVTAASATAQAPTAAATVTDAPPSTPTPDAAALAKPGATVPAMPTPGSPSATAAAGVPNGVATPPTPDMTQPVSGDVAVTKIEQDKKKDQPDAYYDSHLNVPAGPLANSVGPRKVDPVQEPGSKYVVAKKNHSASDTESLLVAANRALELDRNEAALEMFDQLYAKNKRDPRILMGRAVAQQKMGQDDQAIVSYQALLDTDPKNPDALVNMMGLIQKQYPAVALRRLTDMQSKYPGNPGIAAQLGMTYAQMGDNKEAMKELSMAASIEPENAQHTFNMAIIYDRIGDKTNAIRYYEQSLQTDAVYGGSHSIPRDKIYDRLAKLRQ